MTEPLITLVGNPNCGKSVLFNALTGLNQTIGNWSGVTVDKKAGRCKLASKTASILDLPGVHSIHSHEGEQAIDTRITCDTIANHSASLCLNVVDACHLEKGLALSLQLRRMSTPMILVINKADLAEKRHLSINTETLSNNLQCPVIAISSKKNTDIKALKEMISEALSNKQIASIERKQHTALLSAEKELTAEIQAKEHICFTHARDAAESLLCEADTPKLPTHWQQKAANIKSKYHIVDALTSYQGSDFSEAARLSKEALSTSKDTRSLSDRLDNVFLHRWLGVPLFFFMMYLLFFFSINIGGIFQDALHHLSEAFFIRLPASQLAQWGTPDWLISILCNGIGGGISTTITFIPVIASLFLFLSLLEETGYLARGAFVIDRVMQLLGLPGQAFIPMIIGFGCNVPAIMSTRSLSNTGDRIVTSLMAPFMSCGARLAIFAIVANAFFVHAGSLMVFLLYLIGLTVAVLTGLVIRHFLLNRYPSHWVSSLPDYQRPNWRSIAQRVKRRTSGFLRRAGKIIIPTCALIGALTQVNVSLTHGIHRSHPNKSALAQIGQLVTPIFKPMGITEDNWPATVGLATGVMAKEVVIATLNTLYQRDIDHSENTVHWKQEWQRAGRSIIANTKALPNAITNPLLASAADEHMGNSAYHRMQTAFGHSRNAFCYLLFILLYFPCISTLAVMRQELGHFWGYLSLGWSTTVAYLLASNMFQLLTWSKHPLFSSFWLAASTVVLLAALLIVRHYSTKLQAHVETKIPKWNPKHCSSHCNSCEESCTSSMKNGDLDEDKPII